MAQPVTEQIDQQEIGIHCKSARCAFTSSSSRCGIWDPAPSHQGLGEMFHVAHPWYLTVLSQIVLFQNLKYQKNT
jgi:hypothetical protein